MEQRDQRPSTFLPTGPSGERYKRDSSGWWVQESPPYGKWRTLAGTVYDKLKAIGWSSATRRPGKL